MSIVQVSPKGQIVIPAELRRKYNISPKDRVEVLEVDNGIVIVPLDRDPVQAAKGFIKLGRSSREAITELKDELKKHKES